MPKDYTQGQRMAKILSKGFVNVSYFARKAGIPAIRLLKAVERGCVSYEDTNKLIPIVDMELRSMMYDARFTVDGKYLGMQVDKYAEWVNNNRL